MARRSRRLNRNTRATLTSRLTFSARLRPAIPRGAERLLRSFSIGGVPVLSRCPATRRSRGPRTTGLRAARERRPCRCARHTRPQRGRCSFPCSGRRDCGPEALRRCAAEEPAQFCKIVANLLPKEIDSTLKVDVDLFQSCQNFHEAWLLSQKIIGGEIDQNTLWIEAEPENGSQDNDT